MLSMKSDGGKFAFENRLPNYPDFEPGLRRGPPVSVDGRRRLLSRTSR